MRESTVGRARSALMASSVSCLHDLAPLAIAALRNLHLYPGHLQRMTSIGIESFDPAPIQD